MTCILGEIEWRDVQMEVLEDRGWGGFSQWNTYDCVSYVRNNSKLMHVFLIRENPSLGFQPRSKFHWATNPRWEVGGFSGTTGVNKPIGLGILIILFLLFWWCFISPFEKIFPMIFLKIPNEVARKASPAKYQSQDSSVMISYPSFAYFSFPSPSLFLLEMTVRELNQLIAPDSFVRKLPFLPPCLMEDSGLCYSG